MLLTHLEGTDGGREVEQNAHIRLCYIAISMWQQGDLDVLIAGASPIVTSVQRRGTNVVTKLIARRAACRRRRTQLSRTISSMRPQRFRPIRCALCKGVKKFRHANGRFAGCPPSPETAYFLIETCKMYDQTYWLSELFQKVWIAGTTLYTTFREGDRHHDD